MFKFATLTLVILASLAAYAGESDPGAVGDPDFKAKYFQVTPEFSDQITQDNAYFAMIAAFTSEDDADKFLLATLADHPELALQVFQPYPKNFSVMIAVSTTSTRSMKACRVAKSLKIGNIPPVQWTYPHKHKPC